MTKFDGAADLAADEKADFDMLYGECKESEQAKAVMLAGATPAMMFKMEIVETDSEQVRAPSRVRNPAQKMLPVWEPARNASRVRTPPQENATAGREETLTAPSAIAAGRRGDARRPRPAGAPPAGRQHPAAAAWRPGRGERRAPRPRRQVPDSNELATLGKLKWLSLIADPSPDNRVTKWIT